MSGCIVGRTFLSAKTISRRTGMSALRSRLIVPLARVVLFGAIQRLGEFLHGTR